MMQLDMFAIAEVAQRTAHYPSLTDKPACVALYLNTVQEYHKAIMRGDTETAVAVRDECDLFVLHLNGGDWNGCLNLRDWLTASTAAPVGTVPMWGQAGDFLLDWHGAQVHICIDGMLGIGMNTSLLPHFGTYQLDGNPFISETGYRSNFTHCTEAPEDHLTVDAAIRVYLTGFIKREMKGKLRTVDKQYVAAPARHRAEWEALLAAGRSPQDEPEMEEFDDVELEDSEDVEQNLRDGEAGGARDPRNHRPSCDDDEGED